jgi:8-oxo-dGTP pyrophosphatase MutT (NUDIX family)
MNYVKNYQEFLNEKKAHFLSGIVLILENKILLVNPKKYKDAPHKWSIPKGHTEMDYTSLESALKELQEEANIDLPETKFINCKQGVVNYMRNTGREKNLEFYILKINRSVLPFKLYNDMILRFYLNKGEIHEAGFFSKTDAMELIESEQKSILNYID